MPPVLLGLPGGRPSRLAGLPRGGPAHARRAVAGVRRVPPRAGGRAAAARASSSCTNRRASTSTAIPTRPTTARAPPLGADLAPSRLERPRERRDVGAAGAPARAATGALIYLSLGSLGSADVGLMQRLVDILGDDRAPGDRLQGPARRPDPPARQHDRRGVPAAAGDPAAGRPRDHPRRQQHVTEAFHHGKPMVVLPLFWDQVDNAQRIDETGLRRAPRDLRRSRTRS